MSNLPKPEQILKPNKKLPSPNQILEGKKNVEPSQEELKPAGTDSKGMPLVTIEGEKKQTPEPIPTTYKWSTGEDKSSTYRLNQPSYNDLLKQEPERIMAATRNKAKKIEEGSLKFEFNESKKPDPSSLYKIAQRQLNISDQALAQEYEYGEGQLVSGINSIKKSVSNSMNIIENGTPDEINKDLEEKLKFINSEKEKLDKELSAQLGKIRVQSVGTRGLIEDTKSKIEKDFAKKQEELNDLYFSIKALYTKDSSTKFDPFYQTLKKDPSSIKKLNEMTDEELNESLFQFGSDVSFIGESEKKATYKAAYEQSKISSSRLPQESVQGTKQRGNILAITNISEFIKEQEETLTNSIKEINEKYGIEEVDGKISVKKGIQLTQEDFDSYKKEMEQLKPLSDNLQSSVNFVNRLASKMGSDYKNLQYRKDLQTIADDDWKRQGWIDGVGYAVSENLNNKLNSFLTANLALNKFKDNEKVEDLISLERYKYNQPILPTDLKSTPIFEIKGGEIKWGSPKHISYNIAKVTLESAEIAALTMMTGGSALEAQAGISSLKGVLYGAGSRAAMIGATMALTSAEMISAEYEKGLSSSQAFKVGLIKSFFEGLTEIVNPLEISGLDKLAKIGSRLGKDFSEEAYTKVINNAAKSLIGRTFSKETMQVLLGYGKEVLKAGGMETVEEEIGLFLNAIKDKQTQKTNPEYEAEEFNLENVFSTAVNTMISSVGLGGFQAYGERNGVLNSAKFQVAENSEVYLSKLEEDFKNKTFTKAQYEAGKKKIEQLSSIYQTNKTVLDNLEDEEQIDFLINSEKAEEISKLIPTLKDEKLEEKVEELEKVQLKILAYTKKALENNAKTPLEKQESVQKQLIDNLDSFYNDEFISKVKEEDVQQITQDLFKKIFFLPTDKVKEKVDEILSKIGTSLKERQKQEKAGVLPTKPTEPEKVEPKVEKKGLDYLSEKVKEGKITQEEIDELDEVGIAEKVAELKDAEQIAEVEKEIEQVSKIEDPEQKKVAIQSLREKIKEQGLYKALDKLEEVEKGKEVVFEDAAAAFGIKPEEVEETETTPEEKPEAVSVDVKDKKADIEKKYPEYVKNFKQSIFDIRDIVRRLGTTTAASKAGIFDNVEDKFIGKVVTGDNIDEAIKGIVVLGSKGFKRTFIEDIKQEFNKIGQLKKEYDAELSALEGKKEEVKPTEETKPTEFKVGDKVKVNTAKDGESTIKEDRGDKVLLEDGRQVFKKNLSLIEAAPTLEAVQREGEPVVEETKEDLKEAAPEKVPTEESDKEVVKEIVNIVENPANPFTTMTFQTASLISRIWSNSLQKIRSLSSNTGKSFLELGYTITVVNSQEIPFDNFDENTKKYFSKGFENKDYIEDESKRKSDQGKYAVITNEKGEFLYFNEEGEMSTSPKEGFKLAISTFPRFEEKKATRPSKESLSLIGKTIEWYNQQVEKLKNARSIKQGERKTFLIESIQVSDNKKTNTPQDLSEYTNKVESLNFVKGRVFLKLKGLQQPVGLTRRKLTEKEATTLASLILEKALNKPLYDGLPESMYPLEERFKYIKNFIVTGLNYYHKINGKDVYVDLSIGKNGGKPGVYVKIGNQDFKRLTHEETIRLFQQLDLNVNAKIPFDSAFDVFTFNGKTFEKTTDSYGNFVVQNFPAYQKVTPEGKAEDAYVVFGPEAGTMEAQLEDTRVEVEPVVSPEVMGAKAPISDIEGRVGTSNYSVDKGLIFYNNPDGTVTPVANPEGKPVMEVITDDIERRRQEELKPYNERDKKSIDQIDPSNKTPIVKVGDKFDQGLKVIVEKSKTDDTYFKEKADNNGDGVEVITKIISPAEVDKNGKMTKAAKVEVTIFNNMDEATEAINKRLEKVKNLAGKKQKEINAKYNAKLNTLGKVKPEEKAVVVEKTNPIEDNPAEVEETKPEEVKKRNWRTTGSRLGELERNKKLSSEVTEEQNKEAEKWWETTPLRQHVSLTRLTNIVNSSAFATWKAGSITLWKGGNFTDLYHEAWHEFSQLYLTQKQKRALYSEAEKSQKGQKAIKEHAEKLGKKVADLTDQERFFALEEMLAEDFRKYVLAFKEGKPLILDQRPSRNTIFRRIVNFLKELLTGKVDVQTYYERLYTGNISDYSRNLDNAFFGVLNKSGVEGIVDGKKVVFSVKDSKILFKAVDSLVNKVVKNAGKPITIIFDSAKNLDIIYNEVLIEFENYAKNIEDQYFEEQNPERKKELKKILDRVTFIVENWENQRDEKGKVVSRGLKYQHKEFSEFFAIAKEKLSFEEAEGGRLEDMDEDFFNEDKDDAENSRDSSIVKNENVSSKDAASNEVLYLIASLSRYDSSGKPIDNELLPGIPDLVDFKNTWDILSQNLSGITDYERMIKKIEELSEKHKQLLPLVDKNNPLLPKADQLVLSDSELRLRNSFINDLSKPTVFVYEVVVTEGAKGLSFIYSQAGFKAEQILLDEFGRNFEQDDPSSNPYIIQELGTNFLNYDQLKKDFSFYFPTSSVGYENLLKEVGEEEIFLQRVTFLEYLGFKFSPQTLENKDFADFVLSKNPEKNNIHNIYVALDKANVKIQRERGSKGDEIKRLRDLIQKLQQQEATLDKSTKEYDDVFDKLVVASDQYKELIPLMSNPIKSISDKRYGDSKSRLTKTIKFEVDSSSKYFAQSVKNAEQNTVWQIRQWSYITKIYDALNDEEKYPTYDKIKEVPWLQQLNVDVNPYVNGILLNSLFDLTTGQRRTINGKAVKIQLQDYNGLRVNLKTGTTNPGKSTVRLTPFEKLIQNFNSLLTVGIQEHLRYGDKSSSFGTAISGIFNPLEKKITDSKLIVPLEQFTSLIPNQAFYILNSYLASEILPMYINKKFGVGNNVKYYKENIKRLGIFEGVLSEKTQEKIDKIIEDLLKVEREVTISVIKEKLSEINEDLQKDFDNYFKQQLADLNEAFNSVTGVLSTKDYIDARLFGDSNSIELAKRAYVVNSFLYNVEHTKLVTGDPRFYKTKYDENGKETTGKLDPFKRFSQFTATGNLFLTDDATNKTVEAKGKGLMQALIDKGVKILNDKINQDVIASVIFKDQAYSSTLKEVYADYLVNKLGYSIEKANSVLSLYDDVNEADGQGYVTLDEYRRSKLKAGSSHWTKAHEAAYQKEVEFFAGKRKEGMSPKEAALFVPQKWQYSGTSLHRLKNGKQIAVPVFYKFSVVPLIPSAIKNTPFEKIHENLIRQNVGLALFESGSKHASVLNEEGEFNKFFEDKENRTPYTGDYTVNPIFYQYLKEQVNVEPELKEKVTFSTQMRKLITLNLFDNGVPIDYKGKENWNSLTHEQKLKDSNFYNLQYRLSSVVDNLIGIERANIIKELGAEWNEKTKEYTINPKKLSEFLKKEFIKRGLPEEAIEYLQVTENNKFKYPLDASVQRDNIEKILYAIADKRLVQQKISGEALIQVASTGFELNGKLRKPTAEELKKYGFGSSDLMGYLPEGRTKKDGKKVTSASKIKISFSNKWEPLLDLLDKDKKPIRVMKTITKNGKEVEVVDYDASLNKLNSLIKDEEWLDLGNNRKSITLVGVRIPVQGLNSQEFMEVFEFLPASTGNVIIVHPELVAKSGGDFDIDKLTTFFPNLRVNPVTGIAELYQKYNQEELQNLYEYLTKKYEKKIADEEASNKLIASIFDIDVSILTKDQIKEALDEIFSSEKLPSFTEFKNKFNKKAYENEVIDIVRSILEDPENFEQLIRPNDTDLLKPEADKIKNAQIEKDLKPDEKTGLQKRGVWSNLVEFKTILEQFKSNLVGKSNLGIAAVNNTFFSLAQFSGLYLNENYQIEKRVKQKGKYVTEIVDVPIRVNFSHNTIEVDGKTKISLSGLKDWRAKVTDLKGKANYISDVISQFINGFVDVAKDDWIFHINAVKEYVPSMLFLNMAGVDNETNIAYFTSPIMVEYIKEFQKYKNLFVMIKNKEDYQYAKRIAIEEIMFKRFENIQDVQIKNLLEKINILKLDPEKSIEKNVAVTALLNVIQTKASENKELFTKEGLKREHTPEEELMLLAHFEEISKLSSMTTELQRSLNADTGKLSNSFSVEQRVRRKQMVINSGFFGDEPIRKMFNESNIKGFSNEKSGVDSFVSRIFKNAFEVLGSKEFNDWLNQKIKEKRIKVGEEVLEPVKFEYQNTKVLDLVKVVKSDLLAYIFQNNAYVDNTPNAVVDVTRPYFRSVRSIAKSLISFRSRYPELKDSFPIIFNLKPEQITITKESAVEGKTKMQFYNLTLATPINEAEEINQAVTQVRKLANFHDPNYTKEQQLEIQNFAKLLINFMIIQSSGRKDKYNLMNLVPGEFYSPKIAASVEGLAKMVRERNFKDLDTFWNRFRMMRSEYFENGKYEKQPFLNYKSLRSSDLTGEKTRVALNEFNEKVNKLKEKIEVVKRTNDTRLIKPNTEKLFVIPIKTQKSAEKQQSEFKNLKIENFEILTFEGLNNDNYELKVGEAIKSLVEKAVRNKGNIVFSEEGYGKELMESNKLAYDYLSKQLYDIFGYVNPGYVPVSSEELLPKIKPQFEGKFIYSTPGSGKTTLSRVVENVVDTDDLMVDEMTRRHPDFKQNPDESIQNFIFRYVKEFDHKKEINEIVLQNVKKLTSEGKTVLTGTIAFIKDADFVFRMRPENERVQKRFGSLEEAKNFSAKERELTSQANKQYIETTGIEKSIAENLPQSTAPVVTSTEATVKENPLLKAGVKPTDMNGNAAKDIQMAEESTEFIGYQSGNAAVSSTNKYREAWGSLANTGNYSSTDIIMVSGSGTWRGVTAEQIKSTLSSKYKPLLDKAIAAGASFRVGNQYAKGNLSDQLIAEYLQKSGYVEEKLDGYSRWSKPTTPTVTTEVKPEENLIELKGKYYKKEDISSEFLATLGFTPLQITKILKSIC